MNKHSVLLRGGTAGVNMLMLVMWHDWKKTRITSANAIPFDFIFSSPVMRGQQLSELSVYLGNGNMNWAGRRSQRQKMGGVWAAYSVEIRWYSVMQNEFIIEVRNSHCWGSRFLCDKRPEWQIGGETLSFPVLQKQPQYQDISREAGKTEMGRNVKDKSTSQRSKCQEFCVNPPYGVTFGISI